MKKIPLAKLNSLSLDGRRMPARIAERLRAEGQTELYRRCWMGLDGRVVEIPSDLAEQLRETHGTGGTGGWCFSSTPAPDAVVPLSVEKTRRPARVLGFDDQAAAHFAAPIHLAVNVDVRVPSENRLERIIG